MVSLFSTSLAFTMHNHARLSSPASARAPVVSMNSLEYKFVYEQAGSNAKPAGYGKGDMKFDRQTPAPAYPKRSWASTLVYESAGANAKPLGDGKGNSPDAPAKLAMPAQVAYPALEQEFVYNSAAARATPFGDGKGNGPATALVGQVVPTSLGKANSLEYDFVYEQAAAAAAPLGDGKAN